MSQKQNVEQVGLAARVSTGNFEIDPVIVLETLYDRISEDCLEAQNHLSVTEILGVLETIKMAIFYGANAGLLNEEMSKTFH